MENTSMIDVTAQRTSETRLLMAHLLWPGLALAGFFIVRLALPGLVPYGFAPFCEIAYLGAAAAVLLHMRRRALGAGVSRTVVTVLNAMWLSLVLCFFIALPGANYIGLLAVLVVPLAEELFFRELLLRSFAALLGWPLALLFNVALFVFMHAGKDVEALWQAGLLGLVCDLLLWKAGVVAAVLVHAAWNALVMVAGFQETAAVILAGLAGLLIWALAYVCAGRTRFEELEREQSGS